MAWRSAAWLAAAVVTVSPAAAPATAGGGAAGEPVRTRVVPVPDSVVAPRFPFWTADGRAVLFDAKPAGGTRDEVHTIRPDGTGLRCLTCGVTGPTAETADLPRLKPFPFPDGRRVMLRIGDQSPITPSEHGILECAPSVARCDRARIVPIVVPGGDDPIVTQDQREFRVSPDGAHVGFTQVRLARDGEQAVLSVVGRLRRTATAYEIDDARVVSPLGELKSFTPDGAGVLVATYGSSPWEAANPDVMSVDLATGRTARVTTDPDFDEPVELSPDGRSLLVGSGRESGLFATVSRVRRPPLLGAALDPLLAYLFVNHREQLLEPWLVDRRAERAGRGPGRWLGVARDDRYDGRVIPNWSPDGRRVVFWEGTGTGFENDPVDTRIVVVDLPARHPAHAPRRPRTPPSPWAAPVAGYVPAATPLPRSRPGRHSGTATVTATRTPDADGLLPGRLSVSVVYDGFSDDGAFVVDGTESAVKEAGRTTYSASLTLSGRHTGYLRADRAVISALALRGTIESSVDGRRLVLPRPAP
jgi:hypothetical protein